MDEVNIGEHVLAVYNTGTYIGEVLEDRGNYILVEVLAVLEHPTQGDLHKPGQVEGAVFHERKALSFKEKMNVRKRKIKSHEGQVPEYISSLKEAYETLKQTLNNEETQYNTLALKKLEQLNEHYYQF
ncbi:MAG TPA: sporulation phosphorelay system protein KapB [Bacillota bacterium]|nr:sporulation phosphorelay system protein KapB [Bacillota bacterium]